MAGFCSFTLFQKHKQIFVGENHFNKLKSFKVTEVKHENLVNGSEDGGEVCGEHNGEDGSEDGGEDGAEVVIEGWWLQRC